LRRYQERNAARSTPDELVAAGVAIRQTVARRHPAVAEA
jgi:hypothetical protein